MASEKFIVSARKYRPATFRSVVGQSMITNTLQNAIRRQQLAHAYLFCGPRGVGKTTCARIFAKTINCTNLTPEGEACGECPSCRAFAEQRSYNVQELDAASNNSVDDIRDLTERVRIPPQIGRYIVYIIDEVHMLSAAAFNAFLKTLEEPPEYAIFVLATTEKHKILPTILSRCQIFDFKRIRVDDTIDYLEYIAKEEGVSYTRDALNLIALKADGGMRDALSTFDQVVSFSGGELTYKGVVEGLNLLDIDYYFRITDTVEVGDYREALKVFDEVIARGFDIPQFVAGLNSHVRNLLVAQDPRTVDMLELGESLSQRYLVGAQNVKPPTLIRALQLITDAEATLNRSPNQRLHVEIMLISLCAPEELGEKKKRLIDPRWLCQVLGTAVSNLIQVHPSSEKPAAGEAQRASQESATASVAKRFSIRSAPPQSSTRQRPLATAASLGITERDYSPELLPEAWQEFLGFVQKHKQLLHAMLKGYTPTVCGDNEWLLTFRDEMEAKRFGEVLPNAENFLRLKFKGREIKIRTQVEAAAERTMELRSMPEAEYIKALRKENPAFAQLLNHYGIED